MDEADLDASAREGSADLHTHRNRGWYADRSADLALLAETFALQDEEPQKFPDCRWAPAF